MVLPRELIRVSFKNSLTFTNMIQDAILVAHCHILDLMYYKLEHFISFFFENRAFLSKNRFLTQIFFFVVYLIYTTKHFP